MSVQLEVTVYGPELARLLRNDGEEFAYFLDTLTEHGSPAALGADIAVDMPDPASVVQFLRELADAIEAAA